MYQFWFKFGVGDIAFDTITKQEVRIIGVVYTNGRLLNQNKIYFHEISYVLDLPEPENVRYEEDLEEI